MKNKIYIFLILFLIPFYCSPNDNLQELESKKIENVDTIARSIALKTLGLVCGYYGLWQMQGASICLLFEFSEDYLKNYNRAEKFWIVGSNFFTKVPLGLFLLYMGQKLIMKKIS